jgi:Domain of unknown function (DUF6933)
MIFRLSQKLAKKLKVASPKTAPADPNPFADWSAHLFTADRTQYLILTNTSSLYSTVIYGRGITNDSQFLDRALGAIREFVVADGQEFIFRRFIAPAAGTVRFASALNRSVTGSMNDLVDETKMWLTEGDLSPFDTSFKLNEMPMSYLDYRNPRDAFRALNLEQHRVSDGGVR